MSLESVRHYFVQFQLTHKIMEFDTSSATVSDAAATIGVKEAQIAKTLSFRAKDTDEAILVVAAGDTKIDNKKFRSQFHIKARMLSPEDVYEQTGHKIGGVCPFGLKNDLPVYLDESLKRFDTVYPACGSANSAIALNCEDLFTYANAEGWVDVCKGWQEE